MNFFQKMTIKTKLLLLVSIILTALIYFFQDRIRESISNKRSLESVLTQVLITEKASALIHELQEERSLARLYISFKDEESEQHFNTQIERTQAAMMDLQNILIQYDRSSNALIHLTGNIPSKRRETASIMISTHEAADFYSNAIENFIQEIRIIAVSTRNSEIQNQLRGYTNILTTKENLATVSTLINRVFINQEFLENDYAEFSSEKGVYDIQINWFRISAANNIVDFYDNKFTGKTVDTILGVIDNAFQNPHFFKDTELDSETWMRTSASAINLMKEVENHYLNEITANIEALVSQSTKQTTGYIALSLAILLLSIVFSVYIIRGITTSLSTIKEAANRISLGDTEVNLDIKTKDEIGDLANSFKSLIRNTKELSKAAESIGKGAYDVEVNIRGEEDVLGNALDRMRINLQKLSRENEKRTWLLKGNAELNNKIRGEMPVAELTKNVINHLAAYLDVQIGAFYLMEDNKQLRMLASYAFDRRKLNANIVKPGEGLVGQAAAEKKDIIFTNIPEDYIRINSGLGEKPPKNILVWPLLFENEVKGIIEMGSATKITELKKEYLKLVSESISIAIHSSQAREELKSLLEKTQQQAEELEVQQEELRQANEQLTEQKNELQASEEELRTQQEELEHKNKELQATTQRLEEQKEDIERKNRELQNTQDALQLKAEQLAVTSKYKSEFLANMSHELRTPLNSMLLLSKSLSENKLGNLTEKQVESANIVYTSGNDLLRLINEVLDLSKVEAGKISLELADVSFSEIEQDIKSTFEGTAKEKNIEFRISTEEGLPDVIRSDKTKLSQVLRNLLSNAFKFTDEGGKVDLSIYPAPSDVKYESENLQKTKNIIAFSVKDTGIGIPKDKQKEVFEAFQQADSSATKKYGGTGLGLTISRELVSVLGGEIQLESEEGKGSTFTVYLPESIKEEEKEIKPTEAPKEAKIEEKPAEAAEAKAVVEKVAEKKIPDDQETITKKDKVILIVEDDIRFAGILHDFAHERGFKTLVATQGDDGLNLAKQYLPDAIILDIKLPVIDGWTVLSKLKADEKLKNIPVHIMSIVDEKQKGLEMGAMAFLKKPISKEELDKAFDDIASTIAKQFKKVLIIEDDKAQNKAIEELITTKGVSCISAFTGKEGEKLLKKEPVDCVILDLKLPDISGFEILDNIKEDPELTKIPFIIYTGMELTPEQEKKLKKYAKAIVLKTAKSDERLLDEVNLFLQKVTEELPEEKKPARKVYRAKEELKGKSILIADDDMRNVYALLSLLEEEDTNVIVANDGKEALQKLEENPEIDVVLMDIMMPVMDGYEAMGKIREQEKYKDLPIIALTAKAMKGDREKCISAGASDYIPKPVDFEKLLSLLRIWLFRKGAKPQTEMEEVKQPV